MWSPLSSRWPFGCKIPTKWTNKSVIFSRTIHWVDEAVHLDLLKYAMNTKEWSKFLVWIGKLHPEWWYFLYLRISLSDLQLKSTIPGCRSAGITSLYLVKIKSTLQWNNAAVFTLSRRYYVIFAGNVDLTSSSEAAYFIPKIRKRQNAIRFEALSTVIHTTSYRNRSWRREPMKEFSANILIIKFILFLKKYSNHHFFKYSIFITYLD